MDLYNEFAEILDKYGYEVLIVRKDTEIHCSCWDEKTLAADKTCPVCYGLGYTVKVEKHITREQDLTKGQYGGNKNALINVGVEGLMTRQFFFQPQLQIEEGDLIVEVDFSPTGKPIYKNGHIFEVASVDPQKFEKGELIFYSILVKDTVINRKIRGIRIAEADGIINYEIAWKEETK